MKKLLISITLVLALSSCKKLDCSTNTDKIESYMMKCLDKSNNIGPVSARHWYDKCNDTAISMYCEYKETPKAY